MAVISSKNFKKASILYYIAIFILTLSLSFFLNVDNSLFYFAKLFSFCLLIINFFIDRKKVSEILLLAGFVVISLISYTKNSNTDILTLILVVIGCSSFDFRTVVKVQLVARLTGMLSTFTFYLLGIIPDHIMYREDGTIRHSLGYLHPNSLSTHFAYAVFAYLFLRGKNIKYSELTIIFLLNFGFNEITGMRTSFISVFIALFLILLYKLLKSKKILFVKKVNWFFLSFVVTMMFIYLYSNRNGIAITLDEILSGRIRQGNNFLGEYGISFIGNFIKVGESSFGRINILDNMYVKLIVQYGILLSLYYVGVFRYVRKNQDTGADDFIVNTLILVISIYGISESSPLKVETNFFLFLIAKYIKNMKLPIKIRSTKLATIK